VAALSSDRKFLTLAVVNPTESVQETNLKILAIQLGGSSKLWRLTGPNVAAANVVGREPQVQIEDVSLPDVPRVLSVAPISINIYQFQIM
jgi:alpha-N-arabinofuranosidase